jgi:rfaE bifunctional protein kinase chain/domain
MPLNTVLLPQYMHSFKNLTDQVYVIGDVMIDHYIYGNCERISPEAPVQVVDVISDKYTLGGAGNVVKNLVAFGANTGITSVCGDDEGLKIVTDGLQTIMVSNHKVIIDSSRPTTVKTRVVSNKHQLLRLDRESKHYITDEIADAIIAELRLQIHQIKILIISDYCKGVLSTYLISAIIDICRINNVKTIIDSKDPILSKYYNASIIKPNRKEASIATGIKIVDDETLAHACKRIADDTNCEAVIVTLSEEGMGIFQNGKLSRIPTKALEIFDVTGAGDTVIAAIAFALLKGSDLIQACHFANHAAAVVVGKPGSATATLQEIDALG